jgi:hypothetical protein
MNNELFDSIIREQLAQQMVTPSAGVKKSLTKKMFFKNIWFFHKVKLFLSIIAITGTATALVLINKNTSSKSSNVVTNVSSTNSIVEKESFFNEVVTNSISTKNNQLASTDNEQANTNNSSVHPIETNPLNEDLINEDAQVNSSTNTGSTKKSNATLNTTSSKDYFVATNIKSTLEKSPDTNPLKTSPKTELENVSLLNEVAVNSYNAPNFFNNSQAKNELLTINFVEPLESSLQSSELSLSIDTIKIWDVTIGKMRPYIYREFSFDIFSIVQNQGLLSNKMLNETYDTYYWDFYADQEVRKMPTSFGLGINYTIGTYRHKMIFSSGFNYTKVLESKTKYDFNEVTDQAWLDLFDVNEFSWINTYGQDTCTTCFYAQSTDDLKNEIIEDYNRYTYVNVPIQIGYQLNLGSVTLSLKGGLQSSILSNAKGLYVKKTPTIEGEQYYFWKGLEATTLGRKNDMLKTLYFSYMLGADIRLRLTPKVDFIAGYNFIKSAGTLSKTDYLYSKKYFNQTVQVGFAFYPNRIPVIKNSKF